MSTTFLRLLRTNDKQIALRASVDREFPYVSTSTEATIWSVLG